jgi:hypothetical protein
LHEHQRSSQFRLCLIEPPGVVKEDPVQTMRARQASAIRPDAASTAIESALKELWGGCNLLTSAQVHSNEGCECLRVFRLSFPSFNHLLGCLLKAARGSRVLLRLKMRASQPLQEPGFF